jgi:hypothetical protein
MVICSTPELFLIQLDPQSDKEYKYEQHLLWEEIPNSIFITTALSQNHSDRRTGRMCAQTRASTNR